MTEKQTPEALAEEIKDAIAELTEDRWPDLLAAIDRLAVIAAAQQAECTGKQWREHFNRAWMAVPEDVRDLVCERGGGDGFDYLADAIRVLCDLATAQQAEPMADAHWTDAKLRGIASDYFQDAKDWPAAMLCMRHMLMEQRAERVPLTDDKIRRMWQESEDGSVIDFARAIEKAHGITGPEGTP